MGKYADKYVSLPKFEGDAKPGDIVSLIASADAEIAQLQREKAELEKAIRETPEENKHLADGENCALAKLKKVVGVNSAHLTEI